MQHSKIFPLLESLNRQELLRFREYISSPFFNKNEDVALFYDYILLKKEKGMQVPAKEEIFKALFPGEPYKARRIHDILHYLLKLAEEYISYIRFQESPALQSVNYLAEIRERGLDRLFDPAASEAERSHQKSIFRDNNFFFEEYLLQAELDKSFSKKSKIQKDESLQRKADNLDVFYISAKLRDCCEMLNRRHIVQSEYEFNLLDGLLSSLAENRDKYLFYPAISIYYHILMLLKQPDEESHFKALLQSLFEDGKFFPAEELRDMYHYAQNYCVRRINSGHNEYYHELFIVYKALINAGLIYRGKYLIHWDYKNIVSTALRLKEYDWSLTFIHEYKQKLPEEARENAYTYNLANYYYEMGDYSRAVKLLREVEFGDVYYNLDSKTMLLKIYYDNKEDESFLSMVSAFKIYLTRNKLISKLNYSLYSNLLKYIKKAYNLRSKLPYQRGRNFKKQISELKKQVLETPNIANAKWLQSRVDEI